MTNRELLHQKLLEINPRNDLRIVCDAYLDTDEKVDIVLNDILSGKIKTNDDFGYKVLEIDCGFDVRPKENYRNLVFLYNEDNKEVPYEKKVKSINICVLMHDHDVSYWR